MSARPKTFTHIAGISGSAALFRPVAAVLRDHGWTVAVIEQAAAPADIDDLVRRVRVAQRERGHVSIVSGESFGGIAAQTFARAFPAELSHLVLVAAFAHLPWPARRRLVDAVAPVASQVARLVPDAAAPFLRRLTSTTVNATDPPSLRKAYREAAAAPLHVYFENVRTALAFDARPFLPSIETPTLVVHGAYDRLIPLACGEELGRSIPHATLDVVPDAGHLPHVAAPERFVTRLAAWVSA